MHINDQRGVFYLFGTDTIYLSRDTQRWIVHSLFFFLSYFALVKASKHLGRSFYSHIRKLTYRIISPLKLHPWCIDEVGRYLG